jgi:hypothetical protein
LFGDSKTMDPAYVFRGTEKEGGHEDPVVDGLSLLLREEGDVEVSRSVDREPWFGRKDGGYRKVSSIDCIVNRAYGLRSRRDDSEPGDGTHLLCSSYATC